MIKFKVTPQDKKWCLAGDGKVVIRPAKWKVWWYLMRNYHKGKIPVELWIFYKGDKRPALEEKE